MKPNIRKIMLIVIAALVVLGGAVYLLMPLAVNGLVLEEASYQQVIEERGTLIAERRWQLYAPEALVVEELLVAEGESVAAGDLLLRFDDSLLARQQEANLNALQVQLSTLRGELASVQAQKQQYAPGIVSQTETAVTAQRQDFENQLSTARLYQESVRQLHSEGFASQYELEQAQLQVSALESALQELNGSSSQQIGQMRSSYQYYASLENALQEQITTLNELMPGGHTDAQSALLAYQAEQGSLSAPAAGTVLYLAAGVGERADPTQPLITLYEPGYLGVESYVLASDAVLLSPGMEALVVLDGSPKRELAARVVAVSNQAVEMLSDLGLAESRVKVTLTLVEAEPLIVGQSVEVRYIRSEVAGALAVPKTAVFDYETGQAVLLLRGGRAELAPVEKLFETDTLVVLESGLQAGDIVILTPTQDGLRVGTRVRLK